MHLGALTFASTNAATQSSAATSKKITSKKLNANTASAAQLTAAFTAAGIKNANKWSKEVREYRPYTADFAKLHQELGKYGISATDLKKSVSLLTV